MFEWTDKQNGIDDVLAEDINNIAHAVIELENAEKKVVDQTYSPNSENAQSGKAVAEAVSDKQDSLVSGTNIKTINNQSILGSGNITIEGGSSITVDQTFNPESQNAQSGKAVAEAVAPKLELLGVYELQNDITYNILEDASNYTKIMLYIDKNNGVANDNAIRLILYNKINHFVKLTYMQTGITISIFDNFYICETHIGNNVQYQSSVVSRSFIECSGSKCFKMIIYADTLNEADIGKTFSVWGIRK